jgi:hypothetical protein
MVDLSETLHLMCCGWSEPDAATLYSPGRADSHKWVEDIAGTLSPVAAAECICLWAYIVGLRRNSEEEDAFRWTCSLLGSIDFAAADAIWKNSAPIKCKIFMWLAILDRQWISARHQSWTLGSAGSLLCLPTGSLVHPMSSRTAGLAHLLHRHGDSC